ncbi:hypothetical protein YC2023_118004 [Brassica napus]
MKKKIRPGLIKLSKIKKISNITLPHKKTKSRKQQSLPSFLCVFTPNPRVNSHSFQQKTIIPLGDLPRRNQNKNKKNKASFVQSTT